MTAEREALRKAMGEMASAMADFYRELVKQKLPKGLCWLLVRDFGITLWQQTQQKQVVMPIIGTPRETA
jgi:hypothetical protein